MERLPDDVLMLIFELLPTLELHETVPHVCRRWAALVARRVLHVRAPKDLLRVHGALRALIVSVPLTHINYNLTVIGDKAPSICTLAVESGNLFDDSALATLCRWAHLDHLDVFVGSRTLDEKLLSVLMGMRSIVINQNIKPGLLRQLCRSTRLQALHMYGRALHYMPRELGAVLCARRLHLRDLTLRCTELTDKVYHTIAACQNLASLQLYSCWLMRESGALAITRLSQLRRLHVTGARMVRPRTLVSFINHLPHRIEELDLSSTWFGAEHVMPLVTRLPALLILELWRCRLDAEKIMILAEALPNLQTLDLDIALSNHNIRALAGHPTLTDLRCLPEEMTSDCRDKYTVRDPASGRVLHVRAADARYSRYYLRDDGEGYRASLFYHWTRHTQLDPAPRQGPAGYEDDRDYCS